MLLLTPRKLQLKFIQVYKEVGQFCKTDGTN